MNPNHPPAVCLGQGEYEKHWPFTNTEATERALAMRARQRRLAALEAERKSVLDVSLDRLIDHATLMHDMDCN